METIKQQYIQSLLERPLLTKALTTAGIFSLGDFFAQYVDGTLTKRGYDPQRGTVAASWGLLGFTPSAHVFYTKILPKLFPPPILPTTAALTTPAPPSKLRQLGKLCVDQLVFSTFINGAYLGYQNVSQTQHIHQLPFLYTQQFPLIIQANLMLWPAVHIISMKLVPRRYQFMFINCVLLYWSAFLSFAANKVYLLNHTKPQTQYEYFVNNSSLTTFNHQVAQVAKDTAVHTTQLAQKSGNDALQYVMQSYDQFLTWCRTTTFFNKKDDTTQQNETEKKKTKEEEEEDEMLKTSILILDALEGRLTEENIALLEKLEYQEFLPLHQVILINTAKERFFEEKRKREEEQQLKIKQQEELAAQEVAAKSKYAVVGEDLSMQEKRIKALSKEKMSQMTDAEVIAALFGGYHLEDTSSDGDRDGRGNNKSSTRGNDKLSEKNKDGENKNDKNKNTTNNNNNSITQSHIDQLLFGTTTDTSSATPANQTTTQRNPNDKTNNQNQSATTTIPPAEEKEYINPEIARSFYEAYTPPFNPTQTTIYISIDPDDDDVAIKKPLPLPGTSTTTSGDPMAWSDADEQELIHTYIEHHKGINAAKKNKKKKQLDKYAFPSPEALRGPLLPDSPPPPTPELKREDFEGDGSDVFYDEEFYDDVEVGDDYKLHVYVPKHRSAPYPPSSAQRGGQYGARYGYEYDRDYDDYEAVRTGEFREVFQSARREQRDAMVSLAGGGGGAEDWHGNAQHLQRDVVLERARHRHYVEGKKKEQEK